MEQPSTIKDFVHPKAMLTPGAIGLTTMLITNAIGHAFELPHNWTALTISGIFAAAVSLPIAAELIHKVIYFLCNALIIFAMATGANALAVPAVHTTAKLASEASAKVTAMVANYTPAQEQELMRNVNHGDALRKSSLQRFFPEWLKSRQSD